MNTVDTLRRMLDGTITHNSAAWPRWLPPYETSLDDIVFCALQERNNDDVHRAILTILDDPATGIINIKSLGYFLPSWFTTRLFKHPKVHLKFNQWAYFGSSLRRLNYYRDWMVLVPVERVLLPTETFAEGRLEAMAWRGVDCGSEEPMVVNVLAHLIPWSLPSDNPDYHRIARLVEEARKQPGWALDVIVGSHPCLFGNNMKAFRYLPTHLVNFVVTVNTRPDLSVGDSGPR